MTRRDHDADRGDSDRPRKPGGVPVWLWVVVAVAGVVLVCGVAGVIGPMVWWMSGQGDPAAQEAARPGGTYTRANFQALVMGKTEAEVVQAVGNPDTTTVHGREKEWSFLRRTLHPVSGRSRGECGQTSTNQQGTQGKANQRTRRQSIYRLFLTISPHAESIRCAAVELDESIAAVDSVDLKPFACDAMRMR